MSRPVARAVAGPGVALAVLALLGGVLAGVLGGGPATVAAWTAFLLTIPFMSTLLPYVLGIGLLDARGQTIAQVPEHGPVPAVRA